MPRDLLFLLKPNLNENGRVYHCPECAMVEGVLAYHPNVRYEFDVQYVDFARPRPAVIERLGEEHQSCPVLILQREHGPFPERVKVQEARGHRFIAGSIEIAVALASAYGTSHPH